MQIQWLAGAFSVLLAALPFGAAGQVRETIPASVAQALRAAGVPTSSVAIVVQDVSASRPLLVVNGGTPMNPASTMKLVTTYAGLELLGPAYRWRTEAYLNGPLADGVLQGDLVLKGYGDPKLTLEAFWLLLGKLRALGLAEIRGDLVLDRSHFATGPFDPSRFDGESLRPYNVGPDALLLNFKSVRFMFSTDLQQDSARVIAEPRIIDVVNVLRLEKGPCGDWRERLRADFQTHMQQPRALFTGSYAISCGERDMHVAVLEPNPYAGALFRQLWETMGGTLLGTTREGTIRQQSRRFATAESLTLSEIVRDINKFSNNVMARQLYLTIGAEQFGAPATDEKAQRAIKDWIAAKGLLVPELVMENGAGLSRIERISALSLNRILVGAFNSPVMPELIASLPLVAVDGTMRRRMKNDPVAGNAHIKTGSLNDARAISGYVLDGSGRRYALTMIVNHPAAAQTRAAQDALLGWVYGLAQQGG